MSVTNIVVETTETAAEITSIIDLTKGSQMALQTITNWLEGINGGEYRGLINVEAGATQGTATLTVSSTGSVNTETCLIAGISFEAVTSGATGNEFNISTTPATQATNMAAAFNASADLDGIVTAEADGAVVTLTAVDAGTVGNGIQISEGLTNVALSDFVTEDTGSDGTALTIDMR